MKRAQAPAGLPAPSPKWAAPFGPSSAPPLLQILSGGAGEAESRTPRLLVRSRAGGQTGFCVTELPPPFISLVNRKLGFHFTPNLCRMWLGLEQLLFICFFLLLGTGEFAADGREGKRQLLKTGVTRIGNDFH